MSAASCGFNPVGQNTQGNCTSGTGTIVLENTADETVSVSLNGSDGSGSAVTVAAHAVSVVDDPIGSYTLTATGMTSSDMLLSQSLVVLCNVAQEVVVPAGSAATLSVSLIGGGLGHVDSSAFGIACSSDDNGSSSCMASVVPNTTVTLVATADPGNTFAAWSGACGSAGTSSTCTLDVGSGAVATAEFTANPPTPESMTVALTGTGSGTVSSEPAGITCSNDGGGTLCMSSFNNGTLVTLVADPAASSVFAGWSGGGCSGTSPFCSTTISGAESVTATFTLATETLFVGTSGSGSVSSSPAGISCGATCSGTFNYNQSVTLTETPASNWTFAGWSGACSGSGACTVTMNASKGVNATFTQPSDNLVVMKSGTGTGTVAGGPISCGSTCSGSVAQGTMVTLTATAGTGSTFAGWSGNCLSAGVASTCTLTMSAAMSATATFTAQNVTVGVVIDGGTGLDQVAGPLSTGGGNVITCPPSASCSATETYSGTTTINLTATPNHSTFLGWSGACSGVSTTCNVPLTASSTVVASFDPNLEALAVALAGSGGGSVSGTVPDGAGTDNVLQISSGSATIFEPYNTTVTLTESPDGSSSFTGWSGACSGSATTCTITLTSNQTATATFGSGSGT